MTFQIIPSLNPSPNKPVIAALLLYLVDSAIEPELTHLDIDPEMYPSIELVEPLSLNDKLAIAQDLLNLLRKG